MYTVYIYDTASQWYSYQTPILPQVLLVESLMLDKPTSLYLSTSPLISPTYIYNYMYSYACYFAILVKLQLLTSSPTCFIIFQVLEVIGIYIVYISVYTHTYIYIYGKCLGFARNRNHDRQRIIITIIIIIKPLLKIFNECTSLMGVGDLNHYWRSSMNVEV